MVDFVVDEVEAVGLELLDVVALVSGRSVVDPGPSPFNQLRREAFTKG